MKTWLGYMCAIAGVFLISNILGCIISVTDTDDDDDDDSGNNWWDNSTDDSGEDTDEDRYDEDGCYQNTATGCSHLSWSDVEAAIEVLYFFRDTYNGYTKEEARALAREVYQKGIYPEEYLEIVTVQNLGDGRYRAFVVATGFDGYPARELTVDNFELEIDGGDAVQPLRARRFEELTSDEVRADISVVIDDSGSVQDCDANFVAQGLAYLFEELPPVYNAELIKFETDVYLASDWTNDGASLADTMLHYCTDRGSTSLWDAVYQGIQDLPQDGDLRAVVVFTDGMDNDSSRTYKQVVQEAEELGVPVLVAGLGAADIFTLFKLASNTGGAFVYIPTGEEILDAFQTLTLFITDAFVVEWKTDDSFDAVKIRARLGGDDTIADTFYSD